MSTDRNTTPRKRRRRDGKDGDLDTSPDDNDQINDQAGMAAASVQYHFGLKILTTN